MQKERAQIMRVKSIKIKNFMGIQDLEIKPGGKITIIEGPNGSGKTSALEAVKAVLKSGYDASLIRKGADKAEIVLVLDDGVEVKKTINGEGGSIKAEHPLRGKLSSPAGYLQDLVDSLSINPVEFLTCPKKQRTDYLLQSIPLTVTPEQIKAAVGDFAGTKTWAGHAFEVLDTLREKIFDTRTGVNRALKEKKASLEQLERSLPDKNEPTDWDAEIVAIESKIEEIRKEGNGKLIAAKDLATSEKETATKRLTEKQAAAERTMNEKIEAARAEFQKVKDDVQAETSEIETAINERKDAAIAALKETYTPQVEKLNQEKAAAQERAKESTRHNNTREIVQKFTDEVKVLDQEAEKLSTSLEKLDALKSDVMKNLPIKGLEVREGTIFQNGVDFERLNTAAKIEIALQLAQLRSKDLGLVCVDGLELLDQEHFDAMEKAVEGKNLQLIVSRVTDTPFKVTTK
jgi:DNA repair exonuclease SbcCD ATPase subunit